MYRNDDNNTNANTRTSNSTIVAPEEELKMKLTYIPINDVEAPIMIEKKIIFDRLLVSNLADIAGAVIAAASNVTPIT